ncbi:MAG: sugar-binding transcriptional regulator [Casimicrobiaceae bacterium]
MADAPDSRLDDAARAGWLYYIAGKTQDDIALALNVSRPTAQRLVSLCRSERLITFRMDHPVSECMNLAAQLTGRFGLVHCDVVPADGTAETSFVGVAEAVAVYIERLLRSNRTVVMGLGTGRSMRASVERVTPMARPLHRLVSLVGNISPDGSASPFDALIKLAELTQAQYFPMPLPMHASTSSQRNLLLEIESVRRIFVMADGADVWLSGISQIDENAILYRDGFITRDQLLDLIRLGGVGENVGWVFDANGRILTEGTNTRITSIPPQIDSPRPRICIAHGPTKVIPLRAALTGRIVNGLVTDEWTARALLQD